MHILPLPLCGLFSIRAQNDYGQYRPYNRPVDPGSTQGSHRLYLSWGIHIEHAQTAYYETCGTQCQQSYRRRNSQAPYLYYKWNIDSTSAPNERVSRITQLAKLSFNHPSVVLTADVFQYFYESPPQIFEELTHNRTNIKSYLTPKIEFTETKSLRCEAVIFCTFTAQKGPNVHAVFERLDPEILHTGFIYTPLPNRSRIICIFYCTLLNLRDPTFPMRKKKKLSRPRITIRQGHVKHLYMQFFGVSQKRRDIVGLTLTHRYNAVRGHRTGSNNSGAEITSGENK